MIFFGVLDSVWNRQIPICAFSPAGTGTSSGPAWGSAQNGGYPSILWARVTLEDPTQKSVKCMDRGNKRSLMGQ